MEFLIELGEDCGKMGEFLDVVGEQSLHGSKGQLDMVGQGLDGLTTNGAIANPEAASQLAASLNGTDEVNHDGGALLVACADDGALEVLELFGVEAKVNGVAEVDDDALGAVAYIFIDIVNGVPIALFHAEALIHGLVHVSGLAGIVLMGVPDFITHGGNAVPGKPPIEHLGGDAGHLGDVGQNAGAVGQVAVAQLHVQIAFIEELIHVLNGVGLLHIEGHGHGGILGGVCLGHGHGEILIEGRGDFFLGHGNALKLDAFGLDGPALNGNILGGEAHFAVYLLSNNPLQPVFVVGLGAILAVEPAAGLLAEEGSSVMELSREHHGLCLMAGEELMEIFSLHFLGKSLGLFHDPESSIDALFIHYNAILNGAHGALNEVDNILGGAAIFSVEGSIKLSYVRSYLLFAYGRSGDGRSGHNGVGTDNGGEYGVEDAGAAVTSGRCGNCACDAGAGVAQIADGVKAGEGAAHIRVNINRALLADEEGANLKVIINGVGVFVVEDMELASIGATPHTVLSAVLGSVIAEVQMYGALALAHLLIPLGNGVGVNIALSVGAEVAGDELALGVIHEVLAKYDFVMAIDLNKLGKVAELGVAKLCACLVSSCNAVAAAITPHGSYAVVLAAGCENNMAGRDNVAFATEYAVSKSAAYLAVGDKNIGHGGLIHEANAQLFSGAANAEGDVQINADHGGHGTGGDNAHIAVFLAGNYDAPIHQFLKEIGVHLHILEHEILLAQIAANFLNMEGEEIFALDLFGVEILQNTAAAVGLSGITGGLLFNNENIQIGSALLNGDSVGKTGNTAAHHQNIAFNIGAFHVCLLSLVVALKRLEKSLALIIGNNLDCVLIANGFAIEAMLAVVNIEKQRLSCLGVPADNVHKAGLVAQAAAYALFGVEFNFMIGLNHGACPPQSRFAPSHRGREGIILYLVILCANGL